jgi:hypothetical protein
VGISAFGALILRDAGDGSENDSFACSLAVGFDVGVFMTPSTDDAVFSVSDAAVQISEHIMCTPRNGIAPGNYRRVC